ncbi:unnamed protein product [Rotaria sp. Silwood1]|nr:unnamed protein product [Rotaria sp. Silwood1]
MSNSVCTRLNEIHIESILHDHDTFLFDSDGVLWFSPIILSGAIELLNYLTKLFDPIPLEADWIETNTIEFDDNINCVISAFDIHVNYLKIIKAATYLSRLAMLFLTTTDDVTTPQNDVAILPGEETILASIVAASGRSPTILGKPRASMFDSIRLAFLMLNLIELLRLVIDWWQRIFYLVFIKV